MIFSSGLTFIIGSWIYEADDEGELQGRLEDQEHHEDLALSTSMAEELAEKLSRLVMSRSRSSADFKNQCLSQQLILLQQHPSTTSFSIDASRGEIVMQLQHGLSLARDGTLPI